MADDEEQLERPEEEEAGQPQYEDLVTEVPERDVDFGELEMPKTLSEAEAEAPQKSDIQAVLRMLTPHFSDTELDEILQPTMVTRIFPDNLLDKHKLIVLRELQRREPTDRVDLIKIISLSQDALGIGYEGRGIGDRLEAAGVVHEEEMEKLSKEFGL